MDSVKKNVSEAQLSLKMFPREDFQTLMTEFSLKNVSISGMGLFSVNYGFCFVVRYYLNEFINMSYAFDTFLLIDTLYLSAGFNNADIFLDCSATKLIRKPEDGDSKYMKLYNTSAT